MWFEHLAAQTVRPDALLFAHGGRPGDDTWRALVDGARRHGLPQPGIVHFEGRTHHRHDDERFRTLTSLRNSLLDRATSLNPDLVLSLDTDIMLRDPHTIERLCAMVSAGGCDIAGALAFLHPGAPRSWQPGEEVCWAYNFGWLADPGEPERTWLRRPHVSQIDWGQTLDADVPMAVWVANQRASACRYEWHVSGEDIGFARALQAAGCRFRVDTSLYAWHCWSETHLVEQRRTVA